MKMLLWALLGGSIVSVTACGDKEAEICNDSIDNDGNGLSDCYDDACSTDATCVDADGDGFVQADDCNDENALSYPGADEVCDEDDNNCDGEIDENPIDGTPFYGDADLDGYGDPAQLLKACSASEGVADNAADCNDEDATINPDADEVCDEIDNNCDSVIDYDAIDRATFYRDTDGDGYGIDAGAQTACEVPEGFATESGDCDDAEEAANPGATETCDGFDNDCDGTIDVNATDGADYYADLDGDGFGDSNNAMSACEQPEGYVTDNTDCNDDSDAANPNQLEVCDELDNDCDGDVDDADSNVIAASGTDWYPDLDGDGQGDENASGTEACAAPVDSTTGYVYADNANDCNDMDLSVYSGAPETCNGIDDDCDGMPDDKAQGGQTYYPDADGDGFGDDTVPTTACADPSDSTLSYVTIGGDCDDTDSTFNPNAVDSCDGFDQNCSGDETDATGTTSFYMDADEDGFGDASVVITTCVQPEGYVMDNTDCDDAADDVYVGAEELCDAIDNDCDGDVDQDDIDFDATNLLTYYADQDQDGYGDDASSVLDCSQPVGYVTEGGDCNDSRQDLDGDGIFDGAGINPGEIEVYYDGVDADCDGMNDYDQDGDGELAIGECTDASHLTEEDCLFNVGACDDSAYDTEQDCVQNGGVWTFNQWTDFGVNGSDCDDTNATLNEADLDGDGITTCGGDCNEDLTVVDGYGTIGEFTYPGAAFNEDDPTICITDMDEDGYGGVATIGCLDFELFDTYGDGWNGNGLEVYEDGVYIETLANQNLDGVSFNSGAGEYNYVSYCADGQTSMLELVFVDGSFNSEVQFTISDSTGASLAMGQGSGSFDVIVNGVTYTDGDTVFAYGAPQGSDCDDFDATVDAIDADGDGAIDCATDCDSTDPTLNADDLDGDGYSTCEGDCNDSPIDTPDQCTDTSYQNQVDCESNGVCVEDATILTESDCLLEGTCADGTSTDQVTCEGLSEVWTAYTWEVNEWVGDGIPDGALFNPGQAEIPYNGIDENCDGFNDFDQDGDGDNINGWDCDGDGSLETSCDLDGDGIDDFVAGGDCNDNNPDVNSMQAEVCDGVDNDCDTFTDDQDPDLDPADLNTYYEDLDGDGYGNDAVTLAACNPTASFVEDGGDCNDDPNQNGATFNPGIIDVPYDGVDDNCDGVNDFDADGDGEVAAEIDCNGVMETTCDVDGDGVVDFVGGVDCDDTSAAVSSTDLDGDGYSTCDGDCNEDLTLSADGVTPEGAFTYPGAAFNESLTDCLTDYDGDGYAGFGTFGCFDFELFDSYGDGWNGNALEVYEDGVLTDTIANQNLDGVSFNGGTGEYNYVTFCPDPATQALEFYFADGSFNTEVSFEMFDSAGALLLTGAGSGSFDLIVNGVTFTDGDLIYTGSVPQGNDCDDSDPTVSLEDNDGDGVSACAADCDDNDPLNAGTFIEDCYDGQDNDCDGLADTDDDDCLELDCTDGLDDDGDGLIDCDDSDCGIDPVCTEEICDDQQDEDLDGLIDCADPDCAIATVCQQECVDMANNDLGSSMGMNVAMGSNIGMLDDSQGECTMGTAGEDVNYWWTAPVDATYTFQTANSNYDTVVYLKEDCLTDQWACNDDADFDNGDTSSMLEVDLTAGDSVTVVIDGYDEFAQGDYMLDIYLSSEIDCADGLDEDADGAIDCADADCAADTACASSTCPSFDVGTDTGIGVLVGDLSQAPIDNFQATCSAEGGNDLVVSWEASDTGCATFSTESGSMDTIMTVFDACPDAGGVEMACNDDFAAAVYTSEIQYDVVAGDVYYIGIDSWAYSQSDMYSLDISVQSGASCN